MIAAAIRDQNNKIKEERTMAIMDVVLPAVAFAVWQHLCAFEERHAPIIPRTSAMIDVRGG